MEDYCSEIAIQIIDLFEDVLNENNISIPDDCRDSNETDIENQAAIYGETYFNLKDSIADILANMLSK